MELAPLRLYCVASGLARTELWSSLGMAAEAQASLHEDAAKPLAVDFVAGLEEMEWPRRVCSIVMVSRRRLVG